MIFFFIYYLSLKKKNKQCVHHQRKIKEHTQHTRKKENKTA